MPPAEPYGGVLLARSSGPRHCSGAVTPSGSLLGDPLGTKLKVEGSWLAADTSPTD